MSGEASLLRIIGVGSPFTEDSLGLQAIERLGKAPFLTRLPFRVELMALDRPGSGLINAMEGAGAVVVIDAMRSGRAAAEVVRLKPNELRQRAASPSSHYFGVAETLALAEVLGVLPPRLLIYGIEAGRSLDAADWYPALSTLLQHDLSGSPDGTE